MKQPAKVSEAHDVIPFIGYILYKILKSMNFILGLAVLLTALLKNTDMKIIQLGIIGLIFLINFIAHFFFRKRYKEIMNYLLVPLCCLVITLLIFFIFFASHYFFNFIIFSLLTTVMALKFSTEIIN